MKKIAGVIAVSILAMCFVFAEGTKESSSSGIAWPERTVQIVCPYGAGGDTDYNARMLAEYLSKATKKNVVVVNTTGAGGAVGAQKVLDSKPDGYTIYLGHTSGLIMNMLTGAADFTLDDFEIGCLTGMKPGDMVTVRAGREFTTYDGLVKYSKAHPGELKIGISPGAGTHAQVLQMIAAGLDATPVEQGSGPERMAALLGGHLDIVINAQGAIKEYLAAGTLINLGTMVEKRNEYIPDVPTLVEQGYNITSDNYFVALFPKGTDKRIVEKFNSYVEQIVMGDAVYKGKMKDMYMQAPFYANAEKTAAILKDLYGEFAPFKKYF